VKDQLDRLITEMLDRGLLLEEATKEFEKQFIMKGLERSGGNRTRTAKTLGIHRNTLQKKLSPSNRSNP
jgi:DNA-binding NtrC family response regulator